MRAASGQHDFCGQGAATTAAWPHAVGVPASQAAFGGSQAGLTDTRTRTLTEVFTVGGHVPWLEQTPPRSAQRAPLTMMTIFGKQVATVSFGVSGASPMQA